jgi:hypothetical protein
MEEAEKNSPRNDRETEKLDAARYRWLREQHWSESAMAVVAYPKQNVRPGTYCPSGELLDSAIDAAMKTADV